MGRLSRLEPTDTFKILLQYSDAGIKHKLRTKILTILGAILLVFFIVIGTIFGVLRSINTSDSKSEAVTSYNTKNETILLIGGRNCNGTFVNEIEAIGLKNCPKLNM